MQTKRLRPLALVEFRALIGDLQADGLDTTLLEIVERGVPTEQADDVGPLLASIADLSAEARNSGIRIFSNSPAANVLLTVAAGFREDAIPRSGMPWDDREVDRRRQPAPTYKTTGALRAIIALLDELGVELPEDTRADADPASVDSLLEMILTALNTSGAKEP